jgi:hypothetical protein
MRRHVAAVRLGRLPQVDFDVQRMTTVRRAVMVDPLSERMSEMLQRTRMGNGRNCHCERQHQDHTCDPNLHTSLPKSRPWSTVAALKPRGYGLNEVFWESLLAAPFVKN